MGLMVYSLENIPQTANRNIFIYLLDYGWNEPISQALRGNFDKMAEIAAKNKAVIIKGTEVGHFDNEVMSWHHINNQDADDLLPALLLTNKHPKIFQNIESNNHFKGKSNLMRIEGEETNPKLILVPFRRFCNTTNDVLNLINKIFVDIADQKDLSEFRIANEMNKGLGKAIVDSIILEPNISGVGFSFNKLKDYLK
jgi:hypothetical protein